MAPKKEKAAPPASKPAKSGGGKQKKKKWSKGKQKEKVNNAVLFDQASYDKMLTEVPKYKMITPSVLSDRLRVLLQPDPFLNELTNMYERTEEKGSVWVTFKRSSMKPKAKRKKMESAGEVIEYRCLVRATDAKKTISTSLSAKDYLRFQASYSTVLKAHMNALKKRERKDKKKSAEGEKKSADQTKSTSKPNP